MSTQPQSVPTTIVSRLPRPKIIWEDSSDPIQIALSHENEEHRAWNQAMMQVPATMGRRVRIRWTPEVWTKKNGRYLYLRLRHSSIVASCPSEVQAREMVKALRKLAATFHNLYLSETNELALTGENDSATMGTQFKHAREINDLA